MGWPFVIVYMALIIGALYFTFIALPNELNSQHWPETTSEITNGEVVERKKLKHAGTPNSITTYAAKIHYQYEVAGEQYQQNQIVAVDHNTDTEVQQLIQSKYATGKKLKVYYNSEDPKQSMLEPGLSTGNILTGLFLLFGIGAMAFSLYRNARNRKL